jgi:hypothetical protein
MTSCLIWRDPASLPVHKALPRSPCLHPPPSSPASTPCGKAAHCSSCVAPSELPGSSLSLCPPAPPPQLAEAIRLWGNKKRLPDGGTLYGIKIHRRRQGVHRLGHEDWTFTGPEEDSACNIKILNVTVYDLANAPVQHPTLTHSSGTFLHESTGSVRAASQTPTSKTGTPGFKSQ